MNDPLPRFRRFLAETGVMDDALDQQIQSEIQQEANEALEYAIASPDPDLAEVTTDVRRPFRPLEE